jgi:hypothetical protein
LIFINTVNKLNNYDQLQAMIKNAGLRYIFSAVFGLKYSPQKARIKTLVVFCLTWRMHKASVKTLQQLASYATSKG